MTNNNGTNPDPDHTLTPQQQKRVNRCQRAIEKALNRHECLILPQYIVIGTTIKASIRILPRPS